MGLEEVVLHIGTGKTGSTSIQYFLLTNRDLLTRNGWLVQIPDDFMQDIDRSGLAWCTEEALEIPIGKIARGIEASGARRLLWSWEALSNRVFSEDLDRIRRIKAAFPAASYRIVVYLRRQDHWLRSAYPQWGIKDNQEDGPVLQFEEWYDRLQAGQLQWWRPEDLDYDVLLRPWIQVFGRESLTIRVYEKGQLADCSAVSDFREHSGLPKGLDYVVDIENVNQTFNMELHELIALYSRAMGDEDTPVALLYYLDAAARDPFFQSPGFSRFDYSPRIAVDLLERCEPSNARVARALMGRSDGRLFYEPWPTLDDPEPSRRTLTLETAVPILAHLVMVEHQRVTYALAEANRQLQAFEAIKSELATAREQLDALETIRWELTTVREQVHALANRPTLGQRLRFRLTRPFKKLRAAVR